MQTNERTGDTSPTPGGNPETHTPTTVTRQGPTNVKEPARLPSYSRAAAAQRQNDVPEKPLPGVFYAVEHTRLHPVGWRTRRYVKRKNLRLSNQRYAAADRLGNRTMLPMAFGAFVIFLATVIVFVTLTGLVQATQQRFGQEVVTLEDILP